VTILKSAGKTLLFPGDTVTYTLTVVNTGGGTASTVQVTDVLPTDTYYSYVASGDSRSDAGAPTLTWTINTMNPGDSTTLTYQMVVDNTGLVPAGVNTKSNTATATEATTGPYSSNTVTITITANANLQVSKSVSSPAAMVETACSSPCASTVDYSLTNTPVQTGKVIVYDNGVQVGVDNGTGVIIGGNLQNSTIDYTTGAIHLEFISSPSGDVTVSYNQPELSTLNSSVPLQEMSRCHIISRQIRATPLYIRSPLKALGEAQQTMCLLMIRFLHIHLPEWHARVR
jgi:uncharacterized repeat protein (TIGR01451 family)